MLGPIFHLELLRGGRRGRPHTLRWVYAGWLILLALGFAAHYYSRIQSERLKPLFQGAPPAYGPVLQDTSQNFIDFFLLQQLILTGLLTPAFVAGSITDEKARRTLIELLTTDLTNRELIIGKLFGRLAQVAVILVAGWPVFCAVAPFAGLGPLRLLAVFAASVFALVAAGAVSVLASVYARSTRDAVLGLYLLAGLVAFGWPILEAWAPAVVEFPWAVLALDLVRCLDPRYVLGPLDLRVEGGNDLLRRLALCGLGWGLVTVGCLSVAMWRLRPVYARQMESTGRPGRLRRFALRPDVGDNPIRWKAAYVEGLAPIGALRLIPTWFAVAGVFLLTLIASLFTAARATELPFDQWWDRLLMGELFDLLFLVDPMQAAGGFTGVVFLGVLLATFIVGARCSGAITGEREAQAWDSLLLTPLDTSQLTAGKLWGVLATLRPYALAYLFPAAMIAGFCGLPAFLVVLIGFALTALAVVSIGAAGIWASVRSPSSWRSLLTTLGVGYGGGLAAYGLFSPVILIVGTIVYIVILLIGQYLRLDVQALTGGPNTFLLVFFLASAFTLIGLSIASAWWFLREAERYVGQLERTRHWTQPPGIRVRRLKQSPLLMPARTST